MTKFNWKDAAPADCAYYYDEDNGRIMGQVHKIAHTKIWVGRIYKLDNEEKFLGQYISEDFSKRSVEEYWLIESRTLIG